MRNWRNTSDASKQLVTIYLNPKPEVDKNDIL